jgi:large subunit ribosomal protein L22
MTNAHEAKVFGRNMPVSTKHTIEICNFIRGKNLDKARDMLKKVAEKKVAVPFKRFNDNVGHRKGKVGPGRYPVKATTHVIKLLDSLESNAQNKGLDIGSLFLKTVIPNRANAGMKYGRRRRSGKSTNLEIIAEEKEIKKQEKKPAVKEEPKT